jgi:hypothetical protein
MSAAVPPPPGALEEQIEARGASVLSSFHEHPRTFVLLACDDGPLFARYSSDPRDFARMEHERAVRGLLGESGPLRAPAVLADGAGWMLERRIETVPLRGPAAIDAVLAAAATIAARELPEPPLPPDPEQHPWARRLRGLIASGPGLRDRLRARAIRRDPGLEEVTTHGDFQIRNLLFDGAGLWVVDWELCGTGAAGSDLMRLWSTLGERTDRERLFEGALAIVGEGRRRELERLRYAEAMRTLGGMLAAEGPLNRDDAQIERLRAEMPELRRLARGRG